MGTPTGTIIPMWILHPQAIINPSWSPLIHYYRFCRLDNELKKTGVAFWFIPNLYYWMLPLVLQHYEAIGAEKTTIRAL